MFGILKKNKDIEQLLKILEMDASNNYKDSVQEDIRRVEAEIQSQASIGKLNEKQKAHYETVIQDLKQKYQHFTHKDQGRILI